MPEAIRSIVAKFDSSDAYISTTAIDAFIELFEYCNLIHLNPNLNQLIFLADNIFSRSLTNEGIKQLMSVFSHTTDKLVGKAAGHAVIALSTRYSKLHLLICTLCKIDHFVGNHNDIPGISCAIKGLVARFGDIALHQDERISAINIFQEITSYGKLLIWVIVN
jgi:hypothetical protein